MLGAVHGTADGGHIAGDPGGRFVLAHQYGLDLVLLVRTQGGQIAVDRGAVAPGRLQQFHFETQPRAHVRPKMAN